jgi:hypothetical protein
VDFHTPAGVYLGTKGTFNVDLNRLNSVVRRIIFGLFYHHQGRRLPDGYEATAWATEGMGPMEPEIADQWLASVKGLMETQCHGIGRVVTWWVSFSQEDSNTSLWLLAFYRKMTFVGSTVRRQAIERS